MKYNLFVVPFFSPNSLLTCCVHVEILLMNSEVANIFLHMNKKCMVSQNTGFWYTKKMKYFDFAISPVKFNQSLAINAWQQVGTTLARSIMPCTTLSPSQSPIEPPTWTKSSTTMPVLSLHLLQPAFPYIWEQSAECGLDKVGRGHLLQWWNSFCRWLWWSPASWDWKTAWPWSDPCLILWHLK